MFGLPSKLLQEISVAIIVQSRRFGNGLGVYSDPVLLNCNCAKKKMKGVLPNLVSVLQNGLQHAKVAV